MLKKSLEFQKSKIDIVLEIFAINAWKCKNVRHAIFQKMWKWTF